MYICADKASGKKLFPSTLDDCGFESHDGKTKENLRTVCRNIIVNVFKYLKDESFKFPSNHPREAT